LGPIEARQRLVNVLYHRGDLSRAELATALELPKSTIASLAGEMLARGELVEAPGRAAGVGSGRGRPAARVRLADLPGVVVGVDVGHRHVRVAAADSACAILADHQAELDVDQHCNDALDCVGDLLSTVLREAGTSSPEVAGAAIGVPGPVDKATATVQSPTILADWVGVDLRAELRARTGLSMSVANDANLGAYGEFRFGAARGSHDFIYVKASNGIGAALVFGGNLYSGAHGMAGEIGHTQLDPDGPWCRCGNRGCLEAVVSIDVVRAQLEPLGIDPFNPHEVDHPVARKVLAESGRTVGRVLANLANALNPEEIILGGDLTATGAAFLDGVRESIDRLAQPGSPPAHVRAAALGQRAEITGALALATSVARGIF
jgi:predicted NBD/HSP70 family sugar kinase